jgi:hypothetical protein
MEPPALLDAQRLKLLRTCRFYSPASLSCEAAKRELDATSQQVNARDGTPMAKLEVAGQRLGRAIEAVKAAKALGCIAE